MSGQPFTAEGLSTLYWVDAFGYYGSESDGAWIGPDCEAEPCPLVIEGFPFGIQGVAVLGADVFKGNPTPVDHELIPSAVFTQPELGTVGLSEEEAREQEPIEVYATSFRPMKSAFAGHSERVMMKLIVSQATRKGTRGWRWPGVRRRAS